MVRSYWNGSLVVVLALVATASAQTPAPPLESPVKPGDRLLTVQELNRPPEVCRLVRNWSMPDGTQAYQVQAVDTGEMITITENGTLAAPPSSGHRIRAVATRIYHWGKSFRSPTGVPTPPAEVVASTPLESAVAEKLVPGDTRVNLPMPTMTETVPARPLSTAELLASPMKGHTSPAPVVATLPRERKPVHAVSTSLQKTSATSSTPPAERHWPSAFSGQSSENVAVLPPTEPIAVQSQPVPQPPPPSAPVAMPLTAAPSCDPVTSTVEGPCDPKRPWLKKIFNKKDPCAKDPCCQGASVADPLMVPGVPSTPQTVATQGAEPSKVIASHPVVLPPAAPAESSNWRKSWGDLPRKTDEPVAKTPSATADPVASTPLPCVPSKKDDKTAEGWHPFRRRGDAKKGETTARVEEKKSGTSPPAPVMPPAKDDNTVLAPIPPGPPTSTPSDWGSTGKMQDDVASRSTKVPASGSRQAPAYLPHARTTEERDPLARPTDFIKRPLLITKSDTDVAKLTESKKKDAKAKSTNVAQASQKETSSKSSGTATPASATEPASGTGTPQYIPVPVETGPNSMVPNLMQQQPPPMPPMPNVPQAPEPNRGMYTHPNPLTVPPRGFRNAFTNPGVENPIPAETIPPETSTNAFAAPGYEGRGTPPPAIPALMRNTPTISPGPIVGVPPGTPVGGIPMPQQRMPMQGMPMQGMPMQGMPMQQLPAPMQGMPQLPMPQQQLPAVPVQPMGPGNQGVPGMAWMPQQFVPANYFHMPNGSHVNVYTTPQVASVGYQQPQQMDSQANVALLLQMLRESDYPSQREWAADQLAGQSGRVSPQVVSALVTAAKEDLAPMVRTQCLRSLTRLQAQTLPVASLLQQLQSDTDPRVRDAVKDAMTALGMAAPGKDANVQPVGASSMKRSD